MGTEAPEAETRSGWRGGRGGDGGRGGAIVRYRGLAIAPMTMVVGSSGVRGVRERQGESD